MQRARLLPHGRRLRPGAELRPNRHRSLTLGVVGLLVGWLAAGRAWAGKRVEAGHAQALVLEIGGGDHCPHGLHAAPQGPFAALVFCDQGLPVRLTILYFGPMSGGGQGAWSPAERFWSEESWGLDVTSLAWSPDGRLLYVATSAAAGDGGLFELALVRRKVRRLYPSEADNAFPPGSWATHITALDPGLGRLSYEVVPFVTYTDVSGLKRSVQLPFHPP